MVAQSSSKGEKIQVIVMKMWCFIVVNEVFVLVKSEGLTTEICPRLIDYQNGLPLMIFFLERFLLIEPYNDIPQY